jgi:TfoX/Sxy family transcriptional regulator of competence genes
MTESELIDRVRDGLKHGGGLREVKMFGGVGFMLDGKLIAGASKRGLLVRVGEASEPAALALTGARRMVMRGRQMTGYVRIDLSALTDDAVKTSLRIAVPYVQGLPAKQAAKKATRPTK